MIVLKWLIVLAVLGYLTAAAALFFAQRSLIYPIPQTGRIAPSDAGFPEAEEHVLSTSDGEKVVMWHAPARRGQPVVIFFPGNGDTLAGLVGRFREITSDGTGLVALSYRGYAGSSGSPSEQGLLIDAAAAYDFAIGRYAPDRVVLWGFSLGSGVAVALAAEHPIAQLILEAPYTSIADIAATLFRFMPVRWLLRDSFHSDERILRVTAPLLIMHGEKDSTISIAFGEKLFALAHEPKQFVRFPEGGHNDLDQYGATETARRFMAGLKG
jgi:uncharacterized protein